MISTHAFLDLLNDHAATNPEAAGIRDAVTFLRTKIAETAARLEDQAGASAVDAARDAYAAATQPEPFASVIRKSAAAKQARQSAERMHLLGVINQLSTEEVRTLRDARNHVQELAFWPVTYYLKQASIKVTCWARATQAILEHGRGVDLDAAGSGAVSDAIAVASVGNFHHLTILAYLLAAKAFAALRDLRGHAGTSSSIIAQSEKGVMILAAMVGHAERGDLAAIKGIEPEVLAFLASSPFRVLKAKPPTKPPARKARGKGRHHG